MSTKSKSTQDQNSGTDKHGLSMGIDDKREVPSNIYLLNVAFYSFAVFAFGQMYVAVLIARSQALIGDSAAMMIDSLTYLFNSYAERIKNKSLEESDDVTLSETEKELQRLGRTRQRLWLEILPPVGSVSFLIILTIYIMYGAMITLNETAFGAGVGEEVDGASTDDKPDIAIMFFFSCLNMILDILNVTCFARAKHAFGFAVIDKDRHCYMLAYDGSLHNQYADNVNARSEVDLTRLDVEEVSSTPNYSSISEENIEPSPLPIGNEKGEPQEINLNMCSAYTHVFADTLRSTAVLIAAGTAYMFKLGEPEMVDAAAALAVSLIILFSLGPLLKGIFHAWGQLRHLTDVATKLSEEKPLLH